MTSSTSDAERVARATLTWLAAPGDRPLAALVRDHGPAAALGLIRSGRVPADVWPGPGTADSTVAQWQARLASVPGPAQIAGMLDGRIRLACPGDPEWPPQLDSLGTHQPHALWLRGCADLRFASRHSIVITGSRAATAYGSYVAASMASALAANGRTVISGGAFGVDAAAHRGALSADGPTIAVMACGVDVPYPAGHADLFDAISAQGLLVSEWPPGQHVSRLRFLERNRLIAALASGALIVEAGQRSGALGTAQHARDLGRLLMAVPGPVTSDQSAGCHRIIRDMHATLVTSPADVIQALDAQPGLTA